MRRKKDKELIAYAASFVAFVLPKIETEEIILFGSVARGEADEKSDIDLFFNIKDKKEERVTRNILNKQLVKFYKSKVVEIWSLKGITNSIKFEVGKLEKWKLKRSIISDGITLYGKYKNLPKKIRGFVYFKLESIKNITKRNRILRKLFGRREKGYSREGVIKRFNGKKLSSLSFVVPLQHSHDIIKVLSKEKANYSFFELWTDQLT